MRELGTIESIDIFRHVISLLELNNTNYRVIHHAPEGQTEAASKLRGHALSQAAKAMVVMTVLEKKLRRYHLAVLPGHLRLDFEAIKIMYKGTRSMLAPQERAQQLTACEMGTVPPFSFHEELELIVDPRLLDNEEIVFSAGRFDQSICIDRESYKVIAKPQWALIGKVVE